MSGYFYSREAGAEGQILTGEGDAPGVGLDALLDRERPPLKAALAIGSALADVLCIAAEDRMIHGDIRPAHVKVDERGTVSVEGYGVQRRTTRAPEGRPEHAAVDVYGLGVVLHSILSAEPLGQLPKDPDAHDDEVVNRVLAMDFRQVEGKRWLEDVRRFLCQILAWSPQDRPEPLDAANVLASVAMQCPGETLEAWAARATAAPQAGTPVAAVPPPAREEEDLGGPVALAAPIVKGGVRVAPAAKGESTAFWSREKIAAMLAEEDDEDVPVRQTVSLPPARPAEPARPAPPPRPAPPEPPRAAPAPPPRAEPDRSPVRADATWPPQDAARPEPARPTPRTEPPRTEPPRPQPAASASPFGGARIEAGAPDSFEEAPPKKSPMVWVAVGGVVLALLCGGGLLASGGAYYFVGGSASQEAAAEAQKQVDEAKADAEKAKADAEKAAADMAGGGAADGGAGTTGAGDAAKSTPAPSGDAKTTGSTGGASAKSTGGTSTKSTGSTGGTSTKSTTTKATAPKTTSTPSTSTNEATKPVATAGFSVKFSTPGREARLQCGDGQTAEFAGATSMSFASTTTCLVRIDSGKGAVQVSRTATVTCSEDAGKVTCGGG